MNKSQEFMEGYNVKSMFFGIVSIIAGILIFLSTQMTINRNIFIYLSFLFLIIGSSSLWKNLYKRYFYDWRGYIDVITAFILLSIFYGNAADFLKILGIIIALKGLLCVFIPTTKEY